MINIPTKVKIPFLWGKSVFEKSVWTNINLIVGPNGSGKTLLASEIQKQFEEKATILRFCRATEQILMKY